MIDLQRIFSDIDEHEALKAGPNGEGSIVCRCRRAESVAMSR